MSNEVNKTTAVRTEVSGSNSTIIRGEMPAAFFKTVEPPKLTNASDESLHNFRAEWRAYSNKISEVQRQGVAAQPASVISCVEPKLLQLLLRFMLRSKDKTPEEQAKLVEEFVLRSKSGNNQHVEVAEKLQALMMDPKIKDARQRVLELYQQFYDVVERYNVTVPAIKSVKYLLNAVRPIEFRKHLKAEMELSAGGLKSYTPESLFHTCITVNTLR